ncbi:MAG: hypothetical protein J6D03_02230 [Clostridia bacterium]|nr:hypothetical protein [Clostridia bacterium]
MESGISPDVYSEVYSVLKLLGDYYIESIPNSLYKMIVERKNNNYNPEYKAISELNNRNVKKATVSLICLLNKNYWNYNMNIDKILKSNEHSINERYNPDNIFKNKVKYEKEEIQEVGLVKVKKDNWYTKVMKFFSKLLNKFNL